MLDIEVAEQEFKKWWEQESKGLRSLDTRQKEEYMFHVHHGFLKGFMIALEKVSELFSEK